MSLRPLIKKLLTLNNLVILICTICCVYQLNYVTELYLKYDVILQFEMKRPQTISIPDISYCVSGQGAFNMSRLYIERPELIERAALKDKKYEKFKKFNLTVFNDEKFRYAEFVVQILQNFSVNHWMRYLHPFDDVLSFTFITNPVLGQETKLSKIGIEKKMSIKSPQDICYTIKFKDEFSYNFKELMVRAAFGGLLLGISINIKQTSSGLTKQIILHEKGTEPRGLIPSYFIKDGKADDDHNGYDLTFQQYITQLLPPPYVTNCKDYRKSNFESRAHALDDCAYKMSVKMMNSLCCHSVIYLTKEVLSYNYTALSTFGTKETLAEKTILNTCEKKHYQPDCNGLRLIPREKKAFIIENQTVYNYYLYAPLDDNFVTTTQPKMFLLDYLIYSASVLGIWLGISLFQVFRVAKEVVAKILVKIIKKKTVKLNLVKNHDIVIHILTTKPLKPVVVWEPKKTQNGTNSLQIKC